mmetsp:Transcript_21695/g.45641  ORF Transcript_21695/g.45641 Transcript_21695/m.45641 type:complete len:101 (-) Transcript_21695:128-430(-)
MRLQILSNPTSNELFSTASSNLRNKYACCDNTSPFSFGCIFQGKIDLFKVSNNCILSPLLSYPLYKLSPQHVFLTVGIESNLRLLAILRNDRYIHARPCM